MAVPRTGEFADLFLGQPDAGSLADLNQDAIHLACLGKPPQPFGSETSAPGSFGQRYMPWRAVAPAGLTWGIRQGLRVSRAHGLSIDRHHLVANLVGNQVAWRLASCQLGCQPMVMPVDAQLMQAIETAIMGGPAKIPWLPAAVLGVHGRLLGVDAYLLLGLDEHEHQRRRTDGLTTICDRESLRLLSSLPHGEPVQIADLTEVERRGLGRLPRSAAEVAGGKVIRLATPPVTIRLAIVTDDVLDRGLDRASRFAPFAPRLLALTGSTEDLAFAKVEACFYGIGLAAVGADGVVMLADPGPPRRSTGPVTWRVREEAYAAFLAAAGPCP